MNGGWFVWSLFNGSAYGSIVEFGDNVHFFGGCLSMSSSSSSLTIALAMEVKCQYMYINSGLKEDYSPLQDQAGHGLPPSLEDDPEVFKLASLAVCLLSDEGAERFEESWAWQ